MLSEEQIEEFQKIYKGYYGKEISKEEALVQGTALLQLMKHIYKPILQEIIKH